MAGGAVASIHFTRGQARSSPLERTEVVGEGANVVVENCSRVTYYRPVADAGFRRYGRSSDFTGEITDAPIVWEPEFSLGQLYNKGIFLLGYYDELKYFCDAVLEDAPVLLGGLDYAEEGIRIYEAFGQGPGEVIPLRGT
jgi:hypothetical protein